MGWLRNFIRRHTAAMPRDVAHKKTGLLSAVYFFAAWNLLILTLMWTAEKAYPVTEEHKKKPVKWWAEVWGTKDSKVYQFHGFTKVGEYEITGTERKRKGRGRLEREAEEREKQMMKDNEKNNGAPELLRDNFQDPELLSEPAFEDLEKIHREDLNLLVEETNSL